MRRRFADYYWQVGDEFTETDPDWGDWRILGKHGFLTRSGGDRLLAVIDRHAGTAQRLGFTEIAEGSGEVYVRGDTRQMRQFARLVGFPAHRRISEATRARLASMQRRFLPKIDEAGTQFCAAGATKAAAVDIDESLPLQ